MHTDPDIRGRDEIISCAFCGSTALHVIARGLHHPRVAGHEPVNLHVCDYCGSLTTWPVPPEQALRRLYAAFEDGIDPALRRWRGDSPASAWYEHAVRRATRAMGVSSETTFTWIDVGAGAGEIGETLNRNFPQASGISIDWHGRPAKLAADPRHDWMARDLNAPGFARGVGAQADLVLALSVWEHVRDPEDFAREVSSLVRPGGTLYLVCPDFGSASARALGRRWPYWIPGEHLSVPTRRGARICLEHAIAANGLDARVFVRQVGIPYSLGYVLAYLGLPALGRLLRGVPAFPLPVGALEAGFTTVRPARLTGYEGR
jgi:SAM-dependent methyltransferase